MFILLISKTCGSNQQNFKWFCLSFFFFFSQVSQYTGRIHLYACIPGVDLRPRALFENFRPEELESQNPPTDDSKKIAYKCIKDDPRYRHVLVEFIKEWNKLRPIEQKKLVAKPLQLPLSVELCCLKESLNHGVGVCLHDISFFSCSFLNYIIILFFLLI